MFDTLDPTAINVTPIVFTRKCWPVEEVAKLGSSIATGKLKTTGPVEGIVPGDSLMEKESGATTAAETQTMNIVSGRYRSGWQSNWLLELRIDVDGWWPTRLVSADWYQAAGNTVTYFGSFWAGNLSMQATAAQIIIEAATTRSYTNSNFPRIRVTIDRTISGANRNPAIVQFLSEDGSHTGGASFTCQFESSYFRTVEYERDIEEGITQFQSYDTNSLTCPTGWGRVLTEAQAFHEAGIQLMPAGSHNFISSAGSGSDTRWSDAELHAAMVNQFSLWRDEPQWKVWLFAAKLHERESSDNSLLGIMFDREGGHRQGCATFHNSIMGGTDSTALRRQLHTYVHELGHCFNLVHSWEKDRINPPSLNRPDSLSWMNYPQHYTPASGSGGEAAYWANFPFLFDWYELAHLRHSFRNSVIMGSSTFGTSAASEMDGLFGKIVEDNSGLRLDLESKKSFSLGEPVVVEVKLRATDLRGKMVHSSLHPNSTYVVIGIQKPSGEVKTYKPFMYHCEHGAPTRLDGARPSIYESAYIGYGKDGFYFDQVGNYRICAIYSALDGSRVVSNVLTIRVRSPLSTADDEVADLYLGSDQGALFWLLGSDSPSLDTGNAALDLVLDKHKSHPLAVYAELVKGINTTRVFKTITEDRKYTVRKSRYAESHRCLSRVIEKSTRGTGVDNITLNMTMRRLARAQKEAGDKKGAKTTMTRMVNVFRGKGLKPHVIRDIEIQAAETLRE